MRVEKAAGVIQRAVEQEADGAALWSSLETAAQIPQDQEAVQRAVSLQRQQKGQAAQVREDRALQLEHVRLQRQLDRVVLADSMAQVGADRTALLRMAHDDLDLRAVTPLRTIKTRRPTESKELYFVPASEALPPFFRVPWKVGSVFICDDIWQRIEKKGLRGAEFNLAPWAY